MGYTHYWHMNPKTDEEKYAATLKTVRAVVEKSPEGLLAGWDGAGVPDLEAGISLNGRGPDDDHETFFLPENPGGLLKQDFVQTDDDGFVFTFCKTAYKPYDRIVVACLVVLAAMLGDDVRVSSDGNRIDWEDGIAWAAKCLGVQFKNPIS